MPLWRNNHLSQKSTYFHLKFSYIFFAQMLEYSNTLAIRWFFSINRGTSISIFSTLTAHSISSSPIANYISYLLLLISFHARPLIAVLSSVPHLILPLQNSFQLPPQIYNFPQSLQSQIFIEISIKNQISCFKRKNFPFISSLLCSFAHCYSVLACFIGSHVLFDEDYEFHFIQHF